MRGPLRGRAFPPRVGSEPPHELPGTPRVQWGAAPGVLVSPLPIVLTISL